MVQCLLRSRHLKNKKLQQGNVCSLWAFVALLYVKLNLLAFGQGLEAISGNGSEVNKHIGAAVIWGDKAKTLCIVKPFY